MSSGQIVGTTGAKGSFLGVSLVVAIVIALAGLLFVPARAAVPDRITFQGILMVDNEPFTGTAQLVFALFASNSGGSSLWSQDNGQTPVTNGLYNATLGPFPSLAFDQQYWLEVSVNGSPLSPRYPLLSVPYALRAAAADAVAAGAVDGQVVLDGSLTAADIGTDIVSSLDGVTNDGGNIDLVAGTNITITPDDAGDRITISANGGAGDVTDVFGAAGLTETNPGGPQVTLGVGAGDGIEVLADAVAVDVSDFAGNGLGEEGTNDLQVNAGTGLEIASDQLQLTDPHSSGSAFDSRFVNEGQADAVSAAMIAPAVVSSISGVSNDGGNVELVAGANVTITPDDAGNTVTISSSGVPGGGGDVTDVFGGNGLAETNPGGPQVTLQVGAGDGIDVAADAVSVDVTDIAGDGLGEDASNNLLVNTGTGLEVSGDNVQLTSAYSSGSAHDARFMNEGASAGGDLGGTYPSPTVDGLQGHLVSTIDPAVGDVLKYTWNMLGSRWAPADDGLDLPYAGTVEGSGTDGFKVTATGPTYAIHGVNNSNGWAHFGETISLGTPAISGLNNNDTGGGRGTWGFSRNGQGVAASTGRTDRNYGIHTADNLYSLNFHTAGAIMQVGQSGDEENLELGDVVVIAGLGETLPGTGAPGILVRRARSANSSAVIGVVASSYANEWFREQTDITGATSGRPVPLAQPGPIAPGEYLLIVVQGPAQVKASAAAGTIQPGDLLSTAVEAGFAAKAPVTTTQWGSMAMPGVSLGKALEPLDSGSKMIHVFVTLQ